MNTIFRYKTTSFSSLLSLNILGSKRFHLSSRKLVRKVTKRSSVPVYGNSGGESHLFPESDSFNNFYGIESDEGVINFEGRTSTNVRRFDFTDTKETDNVEKIKKVRFGTVRLDSENKPKFHGQFEQREFTDDDMDSFQEPQDSFENNIDPANLPVHSQNSLNDIANIEYSKKNVKYATSKSNQDAFVIDNPKDSFIDDLYFPTETLSERYVEKSNVENAMSKTHHDTLVHDIPKDNFIDDGYFPTKTLSEGYIDKSNDQIESKISDNSPVITQTGISYTKNDSSIKDLPFSLFEDGRQDYKLSDNMKKSSNFIESQYFNHNPSTTGDKNDKENEFGFFDEQYFEDLMGKDLSSKQDSSVDKESLPSSSTSLSKKSSNSFEKEVCKEKYVSEEISKQVVQETKVPLESPHSHVSQSVKVMMKQKYDIASNSSNIPQNSKNSTSKHLNLLPNELDASKFANDVKASDKIIQTTFKNDLPKLYSKNQNIKMEPVQNVEVNKEKINSEETETALDFVKKLRSESKINRPKIKGGKILPTEEKRDQKGFRILSYQVPKLSYFTREEIMTVLKNSVLYSDDDIVVLNKPYNMVMHDSQTTSDPCISQYLEELAKELDNQSDSPKLITVHRLDKETCGCLLLARNERTAQKLLSLFAQRKIMKTYWIVTINVPDPLEGVIDIPIAEGKIDNKSRMVLHPNLPKDLKYENHSKHGKRAVTTYNTIATSGNAALVEVQPETGVKHQIRVHFGFGLSCPILGDHKYSHLTKMAPQKLPSDMLQRLKVRQSKVRYIPMHIYARSIVIPQYREGRNLFVQAPMPTHMSVNLQWLKFKKN